MNASTIALIVGGVAAIAGIGIAVSVSGKKKTIRHHSNKLGGSSSIRALNAGVADWPRGNYTEEGLAYGQLLTAPERAAFVEAGNILDIEPSNLTTNAFAEGGLQPHIHLNKVGMDGQRPIYRVSNDVSTLGPKTIGGGLIGFMRSTAKGLGIPLEELLRKDIVGQMPYMIEFFKRHIKSGALVNKASVRRVKMATLYPAAARYADDSERTLWSKVDPKTKKAYFANIGMDRNKDGITTIGEAMSKIEKQLRTGKSKKYVYTSGS